MKRTHLQRSQKGVSLLETMISVTLLGVGLLGLHGIGLTVASSVSASKDLRTAVVLGQEILETIGAKEFDSIQVGTRVSDYGSIPGYPTHKQVVEIVDDTPEPQMKQVTVSVFWRRQTGKTESSYQVSLVVGDEP